ncbi:MAG: PEP-CTERM sorting domain-containing protein [Lacipirellulaceae bacterium]
MKANQLTDQSAIQPAIFLLAICTLSAPLAVASEINVPSDPAPASLNGTEILNLFDGGSLGDFFILNDQSVLNVQGGTIGYGIYATGSSTINVFAGDAGSTEYASEINSAATINFFGGKLGDFGFLDSITNLFGGDAGMNATITGQVNWHGGLLQSNFLGTETGELNVYGRSFEIDGVPLDSLEEGVPFSVTGRGIEISGTLESHEPFVFRLDASPTNSLTPGFVSPGFATNLILFVPEPSSVALLVAAVFGVSARRRS